MKLDDRLYFDFDKLRATIMEENLSFDEICELLTILRYKKLAINPPNTIIGKWLETNPNIIGEQPSNVYENYSNWCVENSIPPSTLIAFSIQICRIMDVQTKVKYINGKSTRVYY